jgi:hypothetical protein
MFVVLVTDFLALVEEPDERRHDVRPVSFDEARRLAYGRRPIVRIANRYLEAAVRKSLGLEDSASCSEGISFVRDWQCILVARYAESGDFSGGANDDPCLRFTLVSKAQ